MVRQALTIQDRPLVLDFDQSIQGLEGADVLSLSHWQERIRFGCRWRDFQQLAAEMVPQLPARYGCVFIGSGDYHHLSYLLLQRLPVSQPIQLIICDNHPDNMRYPLGIHCGSWVYWASRLPQVSKVHVLGICSADIGVAHAWENHLTPLLRNKLNYWSIGVDTRWLNWLGGRRSNHSFRDADRLMQAFLQQLGPEPVYLSLDKDVLSPQVVQTNWDQGCFTLTHLQALINNCGGRLAGMDITGEVSAYSYHSRIKRWLSALDGQQALSMSQLLEWQQRQGQVNRTLLDYLRHSLLS